MRANREAAQPARGTARLGAEDHSVLVADGEGAARLRGGAGARRAPPLTALPPAALPDPGGGAEGRGAELPAGAARGRGEQPGGRERRAAETRC